jgi:hypothetical protein
MLKVFENFDFSRVGQMQSLLEAHGIPTFIKNQFASSVMGEVPFVEVCPQLFILDERDLVAANRVLRSSLGEPQARADWLCPACGIEMEGQFDQCWKCGSPAVSGPRS